VHWTPGLPCALHFRKGLNPCAELGRIVTREAQFRGSDWAIAALTLIDGQQPVRAATMSPHCRKRLLSQVIISNVSIRLGHRIEAVMEMSSESGRRAHGK
jgi:hypothetical protein